jgi:hypothetical protein
MKRQEIVELIRLSPSVFECVHDIGNTFVCFIDSNKRLIIFIK